ncbi:MAG: hypothetical protein QF486_04000 [Candidatus Woesearchaeota archaeon]|jgi:hypothetical protein|nr:hypothetical protein [Candidatus Woesearchaeota archaeon]MDP7181669.1 hypothetical protein [Candidatus Woesearchaeota archaeon]MDP7198758.1 hypothetical protein [Candidatus Woesearchaeota archaeon]MDP7467242.1 hypothetical protein [Candidatus Woesearchaeota archaeon]MDP7647423.1 hypothetical protein [Candidatus Woesearchaeota archaeon]
MKKWIFLLLILVVACQKPMHLPNVDPDVVAPPVDEAPAEPTPVNTTPTNTTLTNVTPPPEPVVKNVTQNISDLIKGIENTLNLTINDTEPEEPLDIPAVPEGEVRPDFEFKYPSEGTRVKGEVVSLTLRILNFTLGRMGENVSWGEGHFHVTTQNASLIEMERATKTLRGLQPGEQFLTVEMVMNNHSSYGVRKRITIEAQTVTSKR